MSSDEQVSSVRLKGIERVIDLSVVEPTPARQVTVSAVE